MISVIANGLRHQRIRKLEQSVVVPIGKHSVTCIEATSNGDMLTMLDKLLPLAKPSEVNIFMESTCSSFREIDEALNGKN